MLEKKGGKIEGKKSLGEQFKGKINIKRHEEWTVRPESYGKAQFDCAADIFHEGILVIQVNMSTCL